MPYKIQISYIDRVGNPKIILCSMYEELDVVMELRRQRCKIIRNRKIFN